MQLGGVEQRHVDVARRERQRQLGAAEDHALGTTRAQPSHDRAAAIPFADFDTNAVGTLNLLEATRATKPEATFIFTSTNKVYGDTPNFLPLEDRGERLELPEDHRYFGGIDTTISLHQRIIGEQALIDGDYDIHWLEKLVGLKK